MLVGEDPASAVYVGGKQKASAEVGIAGFDHRLPADATHAEVEALLRELNDDPRGRGILLQLPTPPQVDGGALTEIIDPAKDVDGLTPISAGLLAKGRPGLRPCTPARRDGAAAPPRRGAEGAEAVVVGRSDLVGKPVARAAAGRATRRSRSATPARATSPRSAAAPTSSSPPSACPHWCRATG